MRKRLGKVLSLVLATMLLVGSFGSSVLASYDPGTGTSSVDIIWTGDGSATDYTVKLSNGDSITISGTSTSFSGLTPGNSYTYEVYANYPGTPDQYETVVYYYGGYFWGSWYYHEDDYWTREYGDTLDSWGYIYSNGGSRYYPWDDTYTDQVLTQSGTPSYSTIIASGTVTATPLPVATVVVNAGTGAATVGGAGSYGPGDSVTLSATPAAGYDPSTLSWSGDFSGSFTVPNDLAADTTYTVTASYTAYPAQTPTISVTGGSGTIAPSGSLAVGSSVTFAATAYITHDPSTLVWSSNVTDNGDGTATGVVGVSGLDVTATFAAYPQQEATLSVTGGSGTGAGYYTIGDTVTFTASPATGYNPATLSWTGATPGSGNTATATMVLGGISASATFDKYVYTVTANAQGFGSVTESPSVSVEHGDTTTLHAVNGTHGTFSHWEKDGVDIGGSATLVTDPVDDHVTYTAVFESNTYNIYAYPSPAAGGSASVAADETHTPTETQPLAVILSATANPGYKFSHWAQGAADGTDLGSSNPMTVYPQDHTDYYAVFELKPTHAVTAEANTEASEGNSVSVALVAGTGLEIAGEYTEGSSIQLSAITGPEYMFVEWRLGSESGPVVSTNPVLVGEADAHYVGIFEYEYFDVSVTLNIGEAGSVTIVTSPVIKSHSVDLIATFNPGYAFVRYIDNATGLQVGIDNDMTQTVTPEGNLSLTAYFEDSLNGTVIPEPTQPEPEPEEEPIPEDVPEEEEEVPDEEPIPEDVPEEEDNEPDEVANDDGEEEILDEDIPEDTPAMPQTAGIPVGVLFLAGSSLAGLGIKLKKKNK